MIIEMFIFFETVTILSFIAAYFTRHELLWAVSTVMSAIMMMNAYNVEYAVFVYNTTISAYTSTIVSYSYPYIMGINLLFLALSIVLGLFDMFTKYTGKK